MTESPEGGCTCRKVRYRLNAAPMIVHACHCTWCQRETGSAFAQNAVVESHNVELLSGEVDIVDTPSASGRGQRIARCPTCRVALWSNYGGRDILRFVRVGTLDTPAIAPPDVHIFTSTKQPWVVLPESAAVYTEFYDRPAVWSADAQQRLRDAMARAAKA